ncbi:methyltransferase domain-containing protein [Gordonia sp. TBRC 11910]|uniref:Methyltransferase domain-containing protein n=1 Tax=Gordonia asplenii TaxID=2725283 RepID=A0A848L0H8_9ACTN|nr:class I SAM-dependent methyltransferase [Gordonia asplenii]NMO02143.1 methyltransferase domain-containing protein [Gordonia asplenii]
MPSNEELTRSGYDAGAAGFAELFETVFDTRPLDRAIIGAFGEMVDGPIADVGCGTGVVTGMLCDAENDAFGVDLSPELIALARRRRADIDFRIGSMLALDLPDESLGGVLAWYSTIHMPDADLPAVCSEFHRVLKPNGVVLLGFQVGDEPFVVDEAFGSRMHLVFRRRQPDDIVRLLADTGFVEYSTTVRAPIGERTPQAFVIARKEPSIVGSR